MHRVIEMVLFYLIFNKKAGWENKKIRI